jgi:hypothetical protein
MGDIREAKVMAKSNFLFFRWLDKSGNVWSSVQPRKTGFEWMRSMRLEGFKVWRDK